MGMGTAGAVLDAMARMRRAERELARPRGLVRGRSHRNDEERMADRLPFPCFFLCDACGRLEEGSSSDPMRRDGDIARPPRACPACKATAWIDLRQQGIALAYREAESVAVLRHDEKGYVRSFWIGGVTSAAVTTVAILCGMVAGLTGAPLRGLTMVLFMVTWIATSVGLRRLSRRGRPAQARPRRWRRPLPLPRGVPRRSAHGLVLGEASLQAPLSGEACLGWSVRVWSDHGLLLDDQRHGALAVEGEAFERDSLLLELAGREQSPADGDEAFVRFMQCRGLSPHDPSLRVREAVLLPGAMVDVRPRAPEGGSVVLSTGTRALAA